MKLLFHHGIDQQLTGKYYWSTLVGYNFQISNIQAALINSQLSRLTELVEFKKNLFNLYSEEFKSIDKISLISPYELIDSSYWLIVAKLNPKFGLQKEEVIDRAHKAGLDIRPFFYLLSTMPPFVQYQFESTINRIETEELSSYGICLPYGYDMTEDKVKEVSKILRKVLE
jgi:perosamine synthetase